MPFGNLTQDATVWTLLGMSESQEWQEVLNGNGEAFGRIFDIHKQRIFMHALRLTQNRHDAEDIAAGAFLELWRKRKDVRVVDGSVAPWLLVTATNIGLNQSRGLRRYRNFLSRLPRRVIFTAVGALSLFGAATVSVATLRPAAEVITMPIAPPVVIQGFDSTLVEVPAAPSNARYLKIELACFNSKVCAFAEQENVTTSIAPMISERASLPLGNWYDPEDQARIAPINPAQGIQVRVDKGGTWRMYAIYTEQLNPKSAQLPDDPVYGSNMLIGIPNNHDYQEQMFIPVVASNGKPGWIPYNALMHAVPGKQKVAQPVFDIDCKTMIGSVDLN